ncbi:MotA/TolQ/ExbB proton channel family protein [Pectobacterium sp. B2J-2]|uniref:MotA/TolQ/ExbB proton channel family protein n=1 Tax=Pectobacterium sp. B2J-2 TaxID=3385372 RepID=UPI0038FC26E4
MFHAYSAPRTPRRFLFGILLAGLSLLAIVPGGRAIAQPSVNTPDVSATMAATPIQNETVASQGTDAMAQPVVDGATHHNAVPVAPGGSTVAQSAVSAPAVTATDAQKPVVEIENPYGVKAMWEQGDFVSKSTLIILIIMSGASWYILLNKLVEQRNMRRQVLLVQRDFWRQADQSNLDVASRDLPETSVFRYVARSGMVAQRQYEGALAQQIDLNTWLSQSISQAIDIVGDRLQGGLSVLATVGSTAPFIGLFGTVWGIYHALTAIGIAGQASIDKVAGPVGESLIMTAFGLAVAVPAVLGYNWLIRLNKGVLDEVRTFGGELHTVLLGGKATSVLGD